MVLGIISRFRMGIHLRDDKKTPVVTSDDNLGFGSVRRASRRYAGTSVPCPVFRPPFVVANGWGPGGTAARRLADQYYHTGRVRCKKYYLVIYGEAK